MSIRVRKNRRVLEVTDAERARRMERAEYWHLMRTAPNRTEMARMFLEDLGIAVAQPVASQWKRLGRGTRIRHAPVIKQAFDGYLFLGVNDRARLWTALHETRLFRAVVGFDDRPAILERAVVDEAMRRASEGDFDEVAPGQLKVTALCEGDTAKIVDGGAYTGLTGPVDAVGELTAKVLINMLGGPQPLEIPLEQLVRVA